MRDALRTQGEACESLGSPFMKLLLTEIADKITPGNPVADRLLNWPGDVSGKADSVSLRLAGALHSLVLTRAAPELAAQYPPNKPTQLWAAVEAAFHTHATHILHWLDSPPQTNEVRRSAVLIPAAHLIAGHFGKPVALSELGASGGLNLMFDRFALKAGSVDYVPDNPVTDLQPDWTGEPPAPAELKITERRGVDLNPLDPRDPADQLRLRAYLWPDQPERLERTGAAITVAEGQVDTGDVEAWLRARLAAPHQGTTHMIYHTVAWQYFPQATKDACQAMIEAAGAAATADAPLAWFGMEADDTPGKGAQLSLRLWPGDLALDMGRADFHGRWVNWSGETP